MKTAAQTTTQTITERNPLLQNATIALAAFTSIGGSVLVLWLAGPLAALLWAATAIGAGWASFPRTETYEIEVPTRAAIAKGKRSAAAKKGWETRRRKAAKAAKAAKAVDAKRTAAAKKGWETRRRRELEAGRAKLARQLKAQG